MLLFYAFGLLPLITPDINHADERGQFFIAKKSPPFAIRILPGHASECVALDPNRFAANRQCFLRLKTVFFWLTVITHAFY